MNPENRDTFDVITHAGKDRLPEEKINSHFEQGFIYGDLINQRNPFQRSCDHWNTALRHLSLILTTEDLDSLKEYEPELYESVMKGEVRTLESLTKYVEEKYHFIHPILLEYVREGMPLEDKPVGKFTRSTVSVHPLKDVPEKYTDYDACSSCHFFEQARDSEGMLLPHKGICKQANLGAGVFAISKSDKKDTYTFLGCSKYFFPKEHRNLKPIPLNGRLLPFVETNPFTVPLAQLRSWHRHPNINILPVFTEEHFDELKSKDLFGDAKRHHNSTNFAKMYAKMGNINVLTHFTKGLKRTHVEKNEFWGQFNGYLNAEDALFGQVFTEPIPGVKGFAGDPAAEEEDEDTDD